MLIDDVIRLCDERQKNKRDVDDYTCSDCNCFRHCRHNCGNCLTYIHFPSKAPEPYKKRKYDCPNMADFYTCKYAYRYTSEIIYTLQRLKKNKNRETLRVLSFGCGPCTDLFAIEYLQNMKQTHHQSIEYRGVDYSKEVWSRVHKDIINIFNNENNSAKFYYNDAGVMIDEICQGDWTPNLVIFQYFFSDMKKHTGEGKTLAFIEKFAKYFNKRMPSNSYVILNDINLGKSYGGGREYFDDLCERLNNTQMRKGRFKDENSHSDFFPHGYPYGEDSRGEFSDNTIFFDIASCKNYSPFDTCASAQMIIRKRE